MRTTDGKRKKVHFFAMVLSRSRMKFVLLSIEPFTAQSVCQAHEAAFAFFEGVPLVVVYDQDRTMIIDDDLGSVILTSGFRQYVKSRASRLIFAENPIRKAKGK